MSLGWGLARLGHAVTVLDEGDIALRASRGNFALVWVQGKGLGLTPYALWTRRSADHWGGFAADLEAETGIDLNHARPGGFNLCLDEAELQQTTDDMARLAAQPGIGAYPYDILNHEQTRQRLPQIGREVVGAIFSPLDGHVNSLRLFLALHAGFQTKGGSYLPDHTVERLEHRSDGFSITGPWGQMRAQRVILAAGLANAQLAPMLGLDAPVTSSRGHILVTEKVAPFLSHPVVNLRQTNEGSVMIGDSHESGATDTTLVRPLVSAIAARAIRQFPLLADLNIVRSWSALRVMSSDGYPVYDQSTAAPGAFVVNCHSGVTLAAAHALLLAPHIANGQLPVGEFGAFSARRFNVQTAA